MILDWLEVRVVHCVLRSYSLCVVVPQHLGKQVDCLIGDELVVLRSDEFGPRFTWVVAKNVIVV
jgi:hypothetical protein